MSLLQWWLSTFALRGRLMLLASIASGLALLVSGVVLSFADYQSLTA